MTQHSAAVELLNCSRTQRFCTCMPRNLDHITKSTRARLNSESGQSKGAELIRVGFSFFCSEARDMWRKQGCFPSSSALRFS